MRILTISSSKDLDIMGFVEKVKGVGKVDEVISLVLGTEDEAKQFGEKGANKVLVPDKVDLYDIDYLISLTRKVIKDVDPTLIVLENTKTWKLVSSYVAQESGIGLISEVIDVTVVKDKIGYVRYALSNRVLEIIVPTIDKVIVTVPPKKFSIPEIKNEKYIIEKISVEYTPKVKTVSIEEKPKGAVRLEEAQLIVSVGRGFKKKEDLQLAFELAQILGAQIGCSRPIAADLKWLPEEHWVGLSGKKVKPKMYMAIGISGQPQHIAGILDSRIVVAINNDPNAPIFQHCDYGVVEDLYKFVPALINKLKEILG